MAAIGELAPPVLTRRRSRLANAAASLGVPLRAITTDDRADARRFGGTRSGSCSARAVIVLRPGWPTRCATCANGRCSSRRDALHAGQLQALLTDEGPGAAGHANAMARRLGGQSKGWRA
jgi:threonine aldolase